MLVDTPVVAGGTIRIPYRNDAHSEDRDRFPKYFHFFFIS